MVCSGPNEVLWNVVWIVLGSGHMYKYIGYICALFSFDT